MRFLFIFLLYSVLGINTLQAQTFVDYQDKQLVASKIILFGIMNNESRFVKFNNNIYFMYVTELRNCQICKLNSLILFLKNGESIKFANSSFQEKQDGKVKTFYLINQTDLNLLKNTDIAKVKYYVYGEESAISYDVNYHSVYDPDYKPEPKPKPVESKEDNIPQVRHYFLDVKYKQVLMTKLEDFDYKHFNGTSDLLKNFIK